MRGTLIGAERVVGGRDNQIAWFPERIVSIPDDEMRRYGREYRRCMHAGELRMRTAEDYRAAQRETDASDEPPKAAKKSKEFAG